MESICLGKKRKTPVGKLYALGFYWSICILEKLHRFRDL